MGGTTGMGLASAITLQKEGAKVLVIGRNQESCAKVELLLNADCLVFSGDATHPETIEEAIAMAHEKWGSITGLFHVAGGSGRTVWEMVP